MLDQLTQLYLRHMSMYALYLTNQELLHFINHLLMENNVKPHSYYTLVI